MKTEAGARYPKDDNGLFMIPMDMMSLQPEINLDHVKEAGLDPTSAPKDGAELIEWAKAMTKRSGNSSLIQVTSWRVSAMWVCIRQSGWSRHNAPAAVSCSGELVPAKRGVMA